MRSCSRVNADLLLELSSADEVQAEAFALQSRSCTVLVGKRARGTTEREHDFCGEWDLACCFGVRCCAMRRMWTGVRNRGSEKETSFVGVDALSPRERGMLSCVLCSWWYVDASW